MTGGENNGGVEREEETVTAIWDDSTSIWEFAEGAKRVSNRRTPRGAGLGHAGPEVCCSLVDPAGLPSSSPHPPLILPSSSLHPPILSSPLREAGPFLLQSSRRCVADVNVMAVGGGGGVSPVSPAHLRRHAALDDSAARAQEADVSEDPEVLNRRPNCQPDPCSPPPPGLFK
ncbi:hypothetical protein EYF80_044798 [Liparis tanakae]|uniref:Uncharacterized protein n=1 Tax=Liparis tanakae TaxID=230148 RepID=A0A4Z2FW11_9TELE|nr:hypothetical protein EYF80_044798 [Liparis tanakae]